MYFSRWSMSNKDGSITNVNACYFKSDKTIHEDLSVEIRKYPNVFSGTGEKLVYDKVNGVLKSCRLKGEIKDKETFPQNIDIIEINCIEIQCPRDWWITIIDAHSLKEYEKHYIVEYTDLEKFLKKEVYDFKNGEYAEKIIKAIEKAKIEL